MDGNPFMVMDKHVIRCMLGIEIDLIKILSGLGVHISSGEASSDLRKPGNPNAPNNDNILQKLGGIRKIVGLKADKNGIFLDHLYIKPIINATYQPSRIFLPNLLGGYEEDLEKFDVTQQIVATDNNKRERDQGTITVKTKEWAKRYGSKYLKGVSLNDTALISVTANGFDNINSMGVFIPKTFEVRISRDPVALLTVKTKMKLLDGLGLGQTKQQVINQVQAAKNEGGLLANIAALLLEDYVNVHVELKDQEGIRDLEKAPTERDTTDDL